MFPIVDILRFIEFFSLIQSIWLILTVTSLQTPSALQFGSKLKFYFNASFSPNCNEASFSSDKTSNKLKPPTKCGLSFSMLHLLEAKVSD